MIDARANAQLLTLIVRRTIRGSPDFLFDAWTGPELLVRWWGPEHVTCPAAEVDLRVGGRYRIANRFSDGEIVWIDGEFEVIDPPRCLVYTWRLGNDPDIERVTVRFISRDGATEVVICHERVASEARRDAHQAGWEGCLNGLAALAEQ